MQTRGHKQHCSDGQREVEAEAGGDGQRAGGIGASVLVPIIKIKKTRNMDKLQCKKKRKKNKIGHLNSRYMAILKP